MKFKDICALIDDIRLDKFSEGIIIARKINDVVNLRNGSSIQITDTGINMLDKYEEWDSETKILVLELDFGGDIKVSDLVKEIKQIKHSEEAKVVVDNASKGNFLIAICFMIIAYGVYRLNSLYLNIDLIYPDIHSDLMEIIEAFVSKVESYFAKEEAK